MTLHREITIALTPAELRTVQGREGPRYVWVLSLGALFRWVPGSTAEDDGFTVLVPLVGGFLGAWLRCRPSPTPTGTPVLLGDADAHVNVGQGFWFELPASTLNQNRFVTLGTANAAAGDEVEVTKLDAGAFTLTLVNGGPAAGNLAVLPMGSRYFFVAYFDGTNWITRRSALML